MKKKEGRGKTEKGWKIKRENEEEEVWEKQKRKTNKKCEKEREKGIE